MNIINALSGYGIKQVKPNQYLSRCCCHEEKTPSLTLKILDDGKIIAHCFGCGANGLDVVQALGLTADDLFPDDGFNKGEYKQQQQLVFQREQFMSDYRLIKIAESDIKNKKEFTLQDKRIFKAAFSRVNQYKFNADDAYNKLIKQDSLRAEFENAYYEFNIKPFNEKYGIEK